MTESQTKTCKKCESDFVIELDDFSFYKRMGMPAPGMCPECRMKWKLVWRNEHTFYKRTCDLCRESIITMYHPNYPAPVYCNR